MNRRVFISLFGSSLLLGNSFEEYKNSINSSFVDYQKKLEDDFNTYKEIYQKELEDFTNNISKKWTDPLLTSKTKWVNYSQNQDTRSIVDFENQEIIIETKANNYEEELKKHLNKIVDQNTNNALEDDPIIKNTENKALKIIKNYKTSQADTIPVISDIVEKKDLNQQIKESNIIKESDTKKIVIKLPNNSISKKAKTYFPISLKYAKQESIPAELIMSIMHNESSFNPMARSYVPAFGLMQIVPKTAGRDAAKYLYGKDQILSSSFLYNYENNIKVGSAYLHILFYKYLKNIKNHQSRLFCTIASYNTGAGNVSRSFIGDTNITKAVNVINKMNQDEVYDHLLKNLPYDETKKYLKKVNSKIPYYSNYGI